MRSTSLHATSKLLILLKVRGYESLVLCFRPLVLVEDLDAELLSVKAVRVLRFGFCLGGDGILFRDDPPCHHEEDDLRSNHGLNTEHAHEPAQAPCELGGTMSH